MGDNCITGGAWTWASARATGTSHIIAEKGCDDFGACTEVHAPNGSALIAVVSDGAGSAEHSSIGARLTCSGFSRCAARFIRDAHSVADISVEEVRQWIDDIRDQIIRVAEARSAIPHSFAATLVGSIIGSDHSIFVHVGDGASVFKSEEGQDWTIGTWPQNGEYASTTYFVTDDPEPQFQFQNIASRVTQLALFSDGLERLALDFASRQPFSPFFDPLFKHVRKTTAGRDRLLSNSLRDFLNGTAVCERTDDDKTIILARRL
jgi:hypothetical protein